MSNAEYYTELIQKLTAHIAQLEEENNALKLQLSISEGKIEIYSQFYNDFKNSYKTGNVSTKTTSKEITEKFLQKTEKTYDTLLAEYFVTADSNIINSLFENYNIPYSQILTDIRESLPNNIENLVKKFHCENEYKIILKSLEYIKKYKLSDKTLIQLTDNYINNYNLQRKKIAYNYVVQVLKFFPLQIDKFLNNISQYYYDDLDKFIEKQKLLLYGEKKKRGRKSKKNNLLEIEENEKVKEKQIFDYSIVPIQQLINIVKETKLSKKQKSIRMLENLKKVERAEEDCNKFREGVNEFFIEKI